MHHLVLGISIPKTLVIWASSVTLAPSYEYEKGMPMPHGGNGDASNSGGKREALLGTRLMLLIAVLWLGDLAQQTSEKLTTMFLTIAFFLFFFSHVDIQ